MDNEELYQKIQDTVYNPVIKVGRKLAELRSIDVCWDRDDVVNSFYLFFYSSLFLGQFQNKWEIENELYNWLRRKITEVQNHKQVINEGSQECPLDERRAPSDDDSMEEHTDLYDDVLSLRILDEIDLKVLRGELTRHQAARDKHKTYEAYKKELQRKLDKVRTMYYNVITKPNRR